MGKLDPNQYASLDPLNAEELMEKLAEFQRDADAAEADWIDCKAEAAEAKKTYERLLEKVKQIGRAREQAHDLYQLKGGELTQDTPDSEGTLPFDEPEAPVEDPVDGPAMEVPEEAERPAASRRIYPAEQDGQVYRAKSSQGNTCTVKQQAGGWYGRVSGKPLASQQPAASKAMRLIDEYLKEQLDWNPTITLDLGDDPTSKADPVEEPEEDLTGGL